MRFEVTDISGHAPDVGEPGSTGRIDTGTGVFCALSRELAEQHGLDTTEMDGESETDTFWRPKHGMEPLQATIQRSLQRTHERFGDDYYDGPTEVDEPCSTKSSQSRTTSRTRYGSSQRRPSIGPSSCRSGVSGIESVTIPIATT